MTKLIWLHEDCLRASHNVVFPRARRASGFYLGRRPYGRHAFRPETPRVHL